MRTLFAILAVLLVPAAAAAQEDPYKKLKVYHAANFGKTPCPCGEKLWNGSRIEITLNNLNTLKGFVTDPVHNPRAKAKPRQLDFTKEKGVTIDPSLEYPKMNGFITFKKADIKSIRFLEQLDEKTIERLENEKRKREEDDLEKSLKEREDRRKRLEAEEAEALARAEKEKGTEGTTEEIDKAAEKLKEALTVYDKFPESAGWGPAKFQEIAQKGINKIPVTLDELEFSRNYQTWLLGKQYMDKKKEGEKKDEGEPKQ